MKDVVITGASGVVGSVLVKGLDSDFRVTPLTKKDCDTRNIELVRSAVKDNTDVIIHLAWKSGDIYKDGDFDQDNVLMALNILEIAAEKRIPRVILASSVHANEYRRPRVIPAKAAGPRGAEIYIDSPFQGNDKEDWPTSIYGATKIYIEALGKYYAKYKGLDVVVTRLGGVNNQDSPTAKQEVDYEKIFLSHADLIRTFNNLINENKKEGFFKIMTLTSA